MTMLESINKLEQISKDLNNNIAPKVGLVNCITATEVAHQLQETLDTLTPLLKQMYTHIMYPI